MRHISFWRVAEDRTRPNSKLLTSQQKSADDDVPTIAFNLQLPSRHNRGSLVASEAASYGPKELVACTDGRHFEGPYLAQPKLPYKLRSYWKSGDLHCAITIGTFNSNATAEAAAASLTRITATPKGVTADFLSGDAMPLDLSGVIFFRNDSGGGLDLDFDLPGDLSWLLQHGYEFEPISFPTIVES